MGSNFAAGVCGVTHDTNRSIVPASNEMVNAVAGIERYFGFFAFDLSLDVMVSYSFFKLFSMVGANYSTSFWGN